MKKLLIASLTTLFFATMCYSQDVITTKVGEDFQTKVLEVTPTEVKYKKFDNQDGPIFSLLKSDVLMIRYQNGTRDIFNEDKRNETTTVQSVSGADLYTQGQIDAARYYKGYRGAGTGTLVTSLISPLVGLIPAIASSSTTPKDSKLNYPNSDLMKKADYYEGYTKKAKKIKQGKVWKNWGIGFGVNLVAVLAFVSAQ